MKPSSVGSGGYTIIEVMIFLAVSSLMLGSVITLFNGQNQRERFGESVNTFNLRLQDILNDVDTGYFPSNGDFICSASDTGPITFTTGPAIQDKQGKNDTCVFAGKSIARNASDATKFDVQTLVGKRTIGGDDITNITDAALTPLPANVSTATADSGSLSAGVQITKIRSFNDGSFTSASDADKVAILTGFGQAAGAGKTGLKSGAIKSQLAIFRSGSWQAAPNGVIVCLVEGGNTTNGRKATIRIGAGFSQKATAVAIDTYEGCE